MTGDVAVIEDGGYKVVDIEGNLQERLVDTISWSPSMGRKGRIYPLYAKGDIRAAPGHH